MRRGKYPRILALSAWRCTVLCLCIAFSYAAHAQMSSSVIVDICMEVWDEDSTCTNPGGGEQDAGVGPQFLNSSAWLAYQTIGSVSGAATCADVTAYGTGPNGWAQLSAMPPGACVFTYDSGTGLAVYVDPSTVTLGGGAGGGGGGASSVSLLFPGVDDAGAVAIASAAFALWALAWIFRMIRRQVETS